MTPNGASNDAPTAASPAVRSDAGSGAARGRRIAATVDDAARLALGAIIALVAAIAYLFWRTSWGAVDATGIDTAIAAAVLLTPAPTWLAWMLAGALDDRATPGQQRRGIGVRFARSDWSGVRLARFAIHPLSTPGWLWLAAMMYLLAAPLLTWLFLLFAAAVALGGLGSLALLVGGRHTLHDLILKSEVETV